MIFQNKKQTYVRRYRYVLEDGISVIVRNVIVHYRYNPYKGWMECLPCKQYKRIEDSIKRKIPDWFHEFSEGGFHDNTTCVACKRIKRKEILNSVKQKLSSV